VEVARRARARIRLASRSFLGTLHTVRGAAERARKRQCRKSGASVARQAGCMIVVSERAAKASHPGFTLSAPVHLSGAAGVPLQHLELVWTYPSPRYPSAQFKSVVAAAARPVNTAQSEGTPGNAACIGAVSARCRSKTQLCLHHKRGDQERGAIKTAGFTIHTASPFWQVARCGVCTQPEATVSFTRL
jgi:hypothetical protein